MDNIMKHPVHGQVTGSLVYLAYKDVYLHLKVITFVNKII